MLKQFSNSIIVSGRRVFCGNPQLADIVIFDESGSYYVRQAINKNRSIIIFNTRPKEDIYLGYKVFLNLVHLTVRFKFLKELATERKGRRLFLRLIYIEACFMAIKPKAIVTFIDNCGIFHRLSKKCRRFPFIAIQNGFRPRPHPCDTNDYSGYYLQHLFCMGNHTIESFAKMGYQVENFHPVGSLLASLYFDHKRPIPNKEYDILVVSSWRGNIGYKQDVQDTMRSMKIMDLLLSKYILERGLHAAIVLRSERNSADWFIPEIGMHEEAYYREIYGNEIEIVDVDFSKERIIHSVIQNSRIIVSCMSTALLEAFGKGKKVLFCNFTGKEWYYQDLPPSIVTTVHNYESFAQTLDTLRSIPIDEYIYINQKDQQHYMDFIENEPTYQRISNKIEQIIDSFNV
ncbi:MAG: hypothetical protein HQK53_00985 [Oligoflexia bacterium]|nr:hypothetical protein [Oligoflexia bacterium]